MLSVAAATLARSACRVVDLAVALAADGLDAACAAVCGGSILVAFGLHDLGFLAVFFSIALDRNRGYTLGSLSASSFGFTVLK